MEQFKPRNEEEWKMQRDWLDKHIKAGAAIVVDGNTNAVIRAEYDNPIYHFYKQKYKEQIVLLSALGFIADEMTSMASGEIPDTPPELATLKARVYEEADKLVSPLKE